MSQESFQQPNDDIVVDQIAEFFASDNDEAPVKDSADGEVATGIDTQRSESGDSAQPDAEADDGVAEAFDSLTDAVGCGGRRLRSRRRPSSA